jgi:hypothetical protein
MANRRNRGDRFWNGDERAGVIFLDADQAIPMTGLITVLFGREVLPVSPDSIQCNEMTA